MKYDLNMLRVFMWVSTQDFCFEFIQTKCCLLFKVLFCEEFWFKGAVKSKNPLPICLSNVCLYPNIIVSLFKLFSTMCNYFVKCLLICICCNACIFFTFLYKTAKWLLTKFLNVFFYFIIEDLKMYCREIFLLTKY